ncbi:MAG: class I SAM-dependent methyltransferase [Ilumatobacteraceae bacterium]
MLDVGCGPGRHAHEFARREMIVHGIDISQRFVDLAAADAPAGATFERADARALSFDAEFDVVVCLCQGAFGMMTANGDDEGCSRAWHGRCGRAAVSPCRRSTRTSW